MKKIATGPVVERDEVLAFVRAQQCDRCLGISQAEPGDRCSVTRSSVAFIVEWTCPHCRTWFRRETLSDVVVLRDVLRARMGLPADALRGKPHIITPELLKGGDARS